MNIENAKPSALVTARGLFLAFLVILAVLLLAGTIQTLVWFRADFIALTQRQERNLVQASELLEEAKALHSEVGP